MKNVYTFFCSRSITHFVFIVFFISVSYISCCGICSSQQVPPKAWLTSPTKCERQSPFPSRPNREVLKQGNPRIGKKLSKKLFYAQDKDFLSTNTYLLCHCALPTSQLTNLPCLVFIYLIVDVYAWKSVEAFLKRSKVKSCPLFSSQAQPFFFFLFLFFFFGLHIKVP